GPLVTEWHQRLLPDMVADGRKWMLTDDYRKSLMEEVAGPDGNSVCGLRSFVEQRKEFLLNHPLLKNNDLPVVKSMETKVSPSGGEEATVTIRLVKGSPVGTVRVNYALEGEPSWQKVTAQPVGKAFGGLFSKETVFEAKLPGRPSGASVRYFGEVLSKEGGVGRFFPPSGSSGPLIYRVNLEVKKKRHPVVLNEFSCNGSRPRGIGDWIEFHNTSDEVVHLKGYALSDNRKNLRKWIFPSWASIAPRGYLVVWADNKASKLHANFRLNNREPETVYFTDADGVLIERLKMRGSAFRHTNGEWYWNQGNEGFPGLPATRGGENPKLNKDLMRKYSPAGR
ncbi:MAG: lamin tail domain-containing protein, partial [Verrucomicrobiota bacterium]